MWLCMYIYRVYVVLHESMMYACICGCACESMMYIYMRVYVVLHVSQ